MPAASLSLPLVLPSVDWTPRSAEVEVVVVVVVVIIVGVLLPFLVGLLATELVDLSPTGFLVVVTITFFPLPPLVVFLF